MASSYCAAKALHAPMMKYLQNASPRNRPQAVERHLDERTSWRVLPRSPFACSCLHQRSECISTQSHHRCPILASRVHFKCKQRVQRLNWSRWC